MIPVYPYVAKQVIQPYYQLLDKLESVLPAGTQLFHGVPRLHLGRYGQSGTSLPDLVLLVPGCGLLAVELVPGHLWVDPTGWNVIDGWGSHPVPDIVQRAEQAALHLESILSSRFSDSAQISVFRGIVCFAGEIQGQPDLPEWMILSRSDLSKVDIVIQRLQEIMRLGTRTFSQPCAEKCRVLLEELYRPWLPTCRTDDDGTLLAQLTREQCESYRGILERDRVAITGPAGSGKSLLAMEKARRFVAAGHRTLLTCYNRALAQSLAYAMGPSGDQQLVVLNFHDLCRYFCRAASIPFVVPLDTDLKPPFYLNEAPELLSAAAALVPEMAFDAIVVDEAQDFQAPWWDALASISSSPWQQQRLAIFYDDQQNVFRRRSVPTLLPSHMGDVFTVPVVCRNTRSIYSLAESFLKHPISVDLSRNPQGEEPLIIKATDEASMIGSTVAAVKGWLAKGLLPSGIAILCPSAKSNVYKKLEGMDDIPIVTDLNDWRTNGGVLLMTWRKFRGLEADAVVLTDLGGPARTGAQTPHDYYTAITRARRLLTMVYGPSAKLKTHPTDTVRGVDHV